MTTRFVSLVGLQACLLLLVGCGPGQFDDLSDPDSDAPALEGRGCIQGEESGFRGFLEIDENGDPTSLEDNPQIKAGLGEDVIKLDGRVRTASSGLQYAAIAFATLDGDDAELFIEIHIASFGYEVSALAIKMEAQRVSADRLEGVAVTIQDFEDEPELVIEVGTANRPGCD